ncbi:DNA-processing protein DprA [Thorsellia kenyensis]|uniref:DNA-processing protein DprA n=1 Tax=Thorsellia kenyensis TaxID=1549888 RepID=A0ABV6CCH8_9GAMM
MQKEELWIRLSCLHGWTSEQYINIANQMEKNLPKIHSSNQEALLFYGLTSLNIKAFWSKTSKEIQEETTWLNKNNRYLLPLHHSLYPQSIFHSTCAPKLLWCEGNISLLNQKTITMIGTRKPSLYGKYWAKIFTKILSHESFIITSGLAVGIDSIVHQTLLNLNKPSIAIIGSGLSNIYPHCHQKMASDIVKQGGLILSGAPPNTQQTIDKFATKNYLLSTLTKAIFVIEAAMQSGSLMTARFAIEEGRDVFSLAHPIGQSEGTHWLIKQGAHLVTKKEDIYNHMNAALKWIK